MGFSMWILVFCGLEVRIITFSLRGPYTHKCTLILVGNCYSLLNRCMYTCTSGCAIKATTSITIIDIACHGSRPSHVESIITCSNTLCIPSHRISTTIIITISYCRCGTGNSWMVVNIILLTVFFMCFSNYPNFYFIVVPVSQEQWLAIWFVDLAIWFVDLWTQIFILL